METIQYINKRKLQWPTLWQFFGMVKDNGGRWRTTNSTPEYVKNYLRYYRSPSQAYPNSHAAALLTQKFAKYLVENDSELAIKLNIAEEVDNDDIGRNTENG